MVPDLVVAGSLVLILLLVLFGFRKWHGMNVLIDNSSYKTVKPKPIIVDAVNVGNPFSIEVKETTFGNDVLNFAISTSRTCVVRAFWNVDLQKVMEIPHSPSNKNQVAGRQQVSDLLLKYSTFNSKPQPILPTVETPYLYHCQPDDFERIMEEQDVLPRKLSTLMISIEMVEEACSEAVFNEDIVCLLSVLSTEKVHGKNVWKIDSQIIQTAAGRLHTLKNLYSSGVPDLETTTSASSATDLCIICHSNHVTRALLPCRHQCVCGTCFPRTKLCPICRRHVESCLVTCDESHLPLPLPDEEELAEQTRNGLNNMGLFELIRAIWSAS